MSFVTKTSDGRAKTAKVENKAEVLALRFGAVGTRPLAIDCGWLKERPIHR